MKFLFSLAMMSFICDAEKESTRFAVLVESDKSISYLNSLENTRKVQSRSSFQEYGSYQEEGSFNLSSEKDTKELEQYVNKLQQEESQTEKFVQPRVKHIPTTCAEIKVTKKRGRLFKTTPIVTAATFPGQKTYKRKQTTILYLSTEKVRRKRYAADSYDDVEKYTTLDSLEKELLFSGKYAPWQRKLYGMRRRLITNDTRFLTTRKRIAGKKKIKLLRRRSGGVIHEPEYRAKKRQNLSSFEYYGNLSFANMSFVNMSLANITGIPLFELRKPSPSPTTKKVRSLFESEIDQSKLNEEYDANHEYNPGSAEI